LLVTINSSVNILIYCIFGNKFKTLFMQIFCGQKPHVTTVHRANIRSHSRLETMDELVVIGAEQGKQKEEPSWKFLAGFQVFC
jgi:hypothetical protein